MSVRHGERGQALPEMVLFLPLVLAALFGIVYVAQFGVVSERTELTARYGATTAYLNGPLYSARAIYAGLSNSGAPPVCPAPPPAMLSGGAPLPGPTSAPFWQPDSAQSSCTLVSYSVGGAQFLASRFYLQAYDTVTASVAVPAYLQALVGASASASAGMHTSRAADPQTIMYCISDVLTTVRASLNPGNLPLAPAPSGSPPPALGC